MKQGADLHSSPFCQMVAYEVARDGFLDRHLLKIRSLYGERRNVMLSALERHFPEDARWTKPTGGLFLWITLPAPLDSTRVCAKRSSTRRSPSFRGAFYPRGGGERTCG